MGLRDGFGREHDELRISVTDRCNLRCAYCMPEEPAWFPRDGILRYEEIARIARIAAGLGVRGFRITGGEPLVRRDLPVLVEKLAAVPGIEDLSLTTNGLRLARAARELVAAGLRRVNVSLDTLDRETFRRLTRRDALGRVLAGLSAAAEAGLAPVKVNVVLLPGVNDGEVEAMVERARSESWEVRFIEFMPLENDGTWNPDRVLAGTSVRRRIEARWPLVADPEGDPRAPAHRFLFRDGRGAVGFVNSVTEPFCESCARVRLTADGKFRVCLYDPNEVDLKGPMRSGASDDELAARMIAAVRGKGRGGALEILETRRALPLDRTMHQIGG